MRSGPRNPTGSRDETNLVRSAHVGPGEAKDNETDKDKDKVDPLGVHDLFHYLISVLPHYDVHNRQ